MTAAPARHLAAVAAALAARGIPAHVSCLAGTPVLTATGRAAGPDAAAVTIHPDPGAVPALGLDCTCIWTPRPGASPADVAAVAAGILAAAGRPARPAAPAGAAMLAGFLRRYPGWSAFWDKAYGVWRAAKDDPALHPVHRDPRPSRRDQLHHHLLLKPPAGPG